MCALNCAIIDALDFALGGLRAAFDTNLHFARDRAESESINLQDDTAVRRDDERRDVSDPEVVDPNCSLICSFIHIVINYQRPCV